MWDSIYRICPKLDLDVGHRMPLRGTGAVPRLDLAFPVPRHELRGLGRRTSIHRWFSSACWHQQTSKTLLIDRRLGLLDETKERVASARNVPLCPLLHYHHIALRTPSRLSEASAYHAVLCANLVIKASPSSAQMVLGPKGGLTVSYINVRVLRPHCGNRPVWDPTMLQQMSTHSNRTFQYQTAWAGGADSDDQRPIPQNGESYTFKLVRKWDETYDLEIRSLPGMGAPASGATFHQLE
ncbi:hypothetical protein BKA70DRAFT_1231278 [Coprinopsis sp. MPI-PUGE-AT-0042]|nr:hypothetical protein BKA70DRAFT_1231278 [Coprinopsis sp. MPI-PUGE-AT-0042]